jgi:hypothetical protein
LTPKKAKEKRTLVIWPGFDSYGCPPDATEDFKISMVPP